ncbi:MAG: DUF4199 domain-containing protein [Flavobacteriaceae bacterium]|nr:DUF4199 domain-containing protein [Flavobacteriaceae bacterium]
MKNILINSLLAGVVSIIFFLAFHFINPSLNFDFTSSILISTVIYLFFLIRAGFQQRKSLSDFLGFGEVFLPSIAIYAIASLIATMFSYIMIKFNPELIGIAQESVNNINESIFGMVGMSEEQIALSIEEASETVDLNKLTSFSNTIIGWLGDIIIPGLLYALIASLITMKKDKSVE